MCNKHPDSRSERAEFNVPPDTQVTTEVSLSRLLFALVLTAKLRTTKKNTQNNPKTSQLGVLKKSKNTRKLKPKPSSPSSPHHICYAYDLAQLQQVLMILSLILQAIIPQKGNT